MVIDLLDPKEKLERIMAHTMHKCRYCGLAYDNFYEAYECCKNKQNKGKKP